MVPIVCTPHTVTDRRGAVMAGLLVRSAGRDLGYVWAAGSAWRWKTADGNHYGERSTRKSAIDTLADIAKLRAGTLTAVPDARETSAASRPAAASTFRPTAPAGPRRVPAPEPEPEPAPTPIVWADQPDGLTSTLADLFAKQRGGR